MTLVVLACPDISRGYTPYTDSSGFGVGAILEQTDDDGGSRVICYARRSLTRAVEQYTPTNLKPLAIVWAV